MNSHETSTNIPEIASAGITRRTVRRLGSWLLTLLSLIVLLALALFLACWTQVGSRSIFELVQAVSGNDLILSGVRGRLVDVLQIDELSYQSKQIKLGASGLKLSWRPRALFSGKIEVDSLEIVSLRIATLADSAPAKLPLDLLLPMQFSLKQVALGRLALATLQADGGQRPLLQLTAFSAEFNSNQTQHQINAGLSSPWGRMHLQGQIASTRPFALQGEFSYQGQIDPVVPNLGLQGKLSGSLEAISIQAKAISAAQGTNVATRMQGGFSAQVNAFSPQILRSLQANLSGINPADFYADAAQADLHVQADLQTNLTQKNSPRYGLTGHVKIKNAQAGRIDQQRLPLLSLSSDLAYSDTLIALKATQIQLTGNGKIQGAADIKMPQAGLPTVNSNFVLSDIDLKQLDSRLQASKITGVLEAQSSADKQLHLQAQLHEPRASLKLEASYPLDARAQDGVLNLSRLELLAERSRLSGHGEMRLSQPRNFSFQGELREFNPARWLQGPTGSINAQLALSGQLSPKLILIVQVPQLQGEYAGQALSGQLAANWQQDVALQVQDLDFRWGKNTLNAHGSWGDKKEALLLKLEAPDLAGWSQALHLNLSGSLNVQAELRGTLSDPAGKLNLNGLALALEDKLSLDKLDASIDLEQGAQGAISAEVLLQNLRAKVFSGTPAAPLTSPGSMTKLAEQMILSIKGRRDAHQIVLGARINPARQLALQAAGALRAGSGKSALWSGMVSHLSLDGTPDIQLTAPLALEAQTRSLRVGSAQFTGALGTFALEQFEWTPESFKTRGKIKDARAIDILNLLKPQTAIEGDLQLGADWDLELKENVRGEFHLQRQRGDIRIADADGTGNPLALGLDDLRMSLAAGGLVAGTDAQRVALQMDANGSRLGKWQIGLNSQLRKMAGLWALAPEAPLEGAARAEIPDLQWLGPRLSPGLALKGKLSVAAKLGGTRAQPEYQAQLEGRELEAAFAAEGLLLPNGSLSAQLSENSIKLKQLQFFNVISLMPKHAQFRDLNWIGQKGEFNASGEIDLLHQSGNIQALWKQFPLLQRKDRWLVMSGQANIEQKNNIWALSGKMSADGGYFRLPKLPPPSLSEDVLITRRSGVAGAGGSAAETPKAAMKSRFDVSLDMGPKFVFVGRGLDTALAGTLRLRGSDSAPLQASGSIRAEAGLYEGYGQQLEIERGILNFQGPLANPGLNIRALRKGLPVEAGVDIGGTVAAPQVRLVSEPNVPDAEKISWLVLGRGSDQIAGNDASVLMSAASAIFGGDGSRNIPRDVVNGLGFDEFSIGAADTGGGSKMPGQTVAGATAIGAASGDQVISVGKRLAPGLVLSVERGLADASGALQLSWQLTRRVRIIGRAGNEASVDANYTFSFK